MRFTLPAKTYPEPAQARNLILLSAQAACAQLQLRIGQTSESGRSVSFRILPDPWQDWTPVKGNIYRTPSGRFRRNAPPVPYQLIRRQYRTGNPHRVSAVCWHGHRDFFRAIFAILPDLKIRTACATYRGLDHFESTHRSTDRNIGSQMFPLYYTDACNCNE